MHLQINSFFSCFDATMGLMEHIFITAFAKLLYPLSKWHATDPIV